MENGKKVTCILDGSQHGRRFLYSCKNEETEEEGFQMWKYKFLSSIFEYIKEFNCDEFIIAIDSRNNWRKEFFPYYKAHRKFLRKKEDEEDNWFRFDRYFEVYRKLIEDISVAFPIKTIEVDYAEADDIVAVLCKSEQLKDNYKIAITTDQDYIQLLKDPMVKLYDPNNKKYILSDDPKKELLLKIILGDKGDYVPSIQDKHIFKEGFLDFCVNEKIGDNHTNVKIILESDEMLKIKMELKFLEKFSLKASRVMTFPPKNATSILNENKLETLLKENPEMKKRFLRNNKLINLECQPKNIKEEIINKYVNCTCAKNLKQLYYFFINNSFNEFINNNSSISKNLLKLIQ